MTIDTSVWYGAILQQMAAESYMDGVSLTENAAVIAALQRGNTRQGFNDTKGFTRFTDVQAAEFVAKYQIVAQASDYAGSGAASRSTTIPVYYTDTNILANTGMSATLIQQKGTNNFTLAIRSTEFRTEADGGDYGRDALGADVSGIVFSGFALAQLSALEDYFSYLKKSGKLPTGSVLAVSGYSLGGHLATVFTEMHVLDSEVTLANAYTFNGAGRGTWSRNATDPAQIVSYYKSVLADPTIAATYAAGLVQTGTAYNYYLRARAAQISGAPYSAASIYGDPRHIWAQEAANAQFGLGGASLFDQGSSDLSNGAASKITQIYGREFPVEATVVANAGVHGPATGVFVEAQPLIEGSALPGWVPVFGGAADWGNAHALILIADSLAVMRAYQSLDPAVSLETLNTLFSTFSNKRAQGAVTGSNSTSSATTEDDPLESALDALRRLLVGPNVNPTVYKPGPTGFGNRDFRNGFYNNLQELNSAIADFKGISGTQYTIQSLVGFSPVYVSSTAAVNDDLGKAYRYALKNLNPFAVYVTGTQPTVYNDPAYAKFDRDTAPGGLTDWYLEDRATMLSWLNYRNTNNFGEVSSSSEAAGPVRYVDLTIRADGKPISFKIVPTPSGGSSPSDLSIDSSTTKRFVFGTDSADVVQGGPAADQLYGAGGTDLLTGGKGDDYLEGGAGMDVYDYGASTSALVFNSNDGNDMVRDTDGKGVLRYTYTQKIPFLPDTVQSAVIGGVALKAGADEWQSPEGKFKYKKSGTDLLVTIQGDAGGTITIKDFDFTKAAQGAYLGIHLADTASSAQRLTGGTQSTAGDFFLRSDVGGDGAFSQSELPNDDLFGGAGEDVLLGGPGDDTLQVSTAYAIRHGFNVGDGHNTVIEDGSAEPHAPNTIQLDAGIARGMLEAAWLGDELRIRVKATGDALLVKDFYTQPQSWQEGWTLLDASGASCGLEVLEEGAQLSGAERLAAQKDEFRGRREQVFGASRIAEVSNVSTLEGRL